MRAIAMVASAESVKPRPRSVTDGVGLYGGAYRFVRGDTGQALEMLLPEVIEVA